MCGILGFFEIKGHHDRAAMQAAGQKMLKTLHHRGPDDKGLWQDPDLSLLLGHTRLAIIDLSDTGAQPMVSHSERYVISYNGEIYNYPALMSDLEEAGVSFRGRSDTEVLLAALDHWGLNRTLQKLNGMFAFALWDRKTRQLHLIRDRLGKKPLYTGWAGGNLVFASELKALRAYPDFKADINRNALTLFMRYAYVPPPFSIFENIWQIPAGCRLTLDLSSLETNADLSVLMEPYWHHPRIIEEAKTKNVSKTDHEVIEEFDTLLQDCVRDRMISDVPLGAFLSGGVDSSLIVAMMQRASGQKVKTFSVGFAETGFNEMPYAGKIAKHLNTDHHELHVSARDALEIIPKLPDIYDEPFADPSQIPTCIISHFARKEVTVALSGDGGDEMFGGYLRHYAAPEIWRRVGWMPLAVRRAMATGMLSVSAERWSRLVPQYPQFGDRLYKIAELIRQKDPQAAYASLTGNWLDPASLVIDGHEPLIPLNDPAWQPKGLNFAEQMMYGDALSYLPNDILVKVDRASMATSLEVRAPLLDYRIFEYAWALPHRMKIRDGKGKWLLRQVLSRYVPDRLFERPKQGFTIPVANWLSGPLKEWAGDLLSEDRIKQEGFFNHAPVRDAWEQHLQGKGRHGTRLWTVLMFNSWLERWQ